MKCNLIRPFLRLGEIESSESVGSSPRIGHPGKRMLGAVLGVRHPGLGWRVIGQKPSSSGPSPVAVTAEYTWCVALIETSVRETLICVLF